MEIHCFHLINYMVDDNTNIVDCKDKKLSL